MGGAGGPSVGHCPTVAASTPIDHCADRPARALAVAWYYIGLRLTAPRQPHQREGDEWFTLDRILAEEAVVLDLVDARDVRAQLWVDEHDSAGLSANQKRAVRNIAVTRWLVQSLSAPAGAGKTTSMRALTAAAHRWNRGVVVLAPTGNAVDVTIREGAGDTGYTIAKALHKLDNGTLTLGHLDVIVVDEAAMVGTADLCRLLTATLNEPAAALCAWSAPPRSPGW
jgi:ATP-dependent exoDNAse (exonuclease V) alpha subunit